MSTDVAMPKIASTTLSVFVKTAFVRSCKFYFASTKVMQRRSVLILILLAVTSAIAHGECIISDDTGTEIRLEHPVKRVVTLYGSLSDILDSIGAGSCLVARTESDSEGARAHLPAVGTHMRPNLELVAAFGPDIVLQLETGRAQALESVRLLRKLGIPVAVFRIRSFAELFDAIKRIGILTGRVADAEKVVAVMQSRLKAIRERQQDSKIRPAVFFEVRYPNLLTAGTDSMVNEIIEAAGGRNAVSRPGMVSRISEEELLRLEPDVYLVQKGPMNKNPRPLALRPFFKELRAVKQERVFIVNEQSFSRPGPLSIDAVEELAHFLETAP